MPGEAVTVQEAARAAGLSPQAVLSAALRGRIRSRKGHWRRWIDPAGLLAYVRAREAPQRALAAAQAALRAEVLREAELGRLSARLQATRTS